MKWLGDPSPAALRIAAYQLCRPLAFVRIKHRHMAIYTRLLPMGFAGMGILVFCLLPIRPQLFGANGLVATILSVMGNLPGFFIAALAAVATFNRDSMDHELPDDAAPKLWMMNGLQGEDVKLTRRVFLCHVFAYLSTLSFAIIVLCISGNAIAPSVISALSSYGCSAYAFVSIKYLYLSILTTFLSSLMITSLYGMYYLVERMHQDI